MAQFAGISFMLVRRARMIILEGQEINDKDYDYGDDDNLSAREHQIQ